MPARHKSNPAESHATGFQVFPRHPSLPVVLPQE
jgi:hypothetical protein